MKSWRRAVCVAKWTRRENAALARCQSHTVLSPNRAHQHTLLAPRGFRALHTTSSTYKEDYYKVLGVPRNASKKEIKKAYYELAKKHHPDGNKGDAGNPRKFTEIGEAYEVLGDDSKRQMYDATGHSEYTSSGRTGQGHPFTEMRAEEIYRQFFGDQFDLGSMFGGQSQQTTHQLVLSLSFMEAVKGCTKDISLRVQAPCERCLGSGGEPGTKEQTCPYCRGRGEEVINTGLFHMKSTCRRCHGQGKIISTPCRQCGGTGTTTRAQTVSVQVPAGVADGQMVRVPVGSSEAYVVLKVQDSDRFERDGFDIHSDATASFTQATLGGEVTIPGISGPIVVKIPKGVQSHHRIRLSGRGIPRLNSFGTGDHYVHIKIRIPKRLTDRQRELIAEFARSEDLQDGGTVNGLEQGRGESEGPRDIMARPPPAEKGILQRLKEVFWKEEPPEDEKEEGDSENRQKMS